MTSTPARNVRAERAEELPLERIRELLNQVKSSGLNDLAWELGIHVDGIATALGEGAARLAGLEGEVLQMKEHLTREHREYAELRESMDELLNLHELSEAISFCFKVEDILDALMNLSNRFVAYESCGVFSISADDSLSPMTMRGNESALGQKIESLWEDGIIDWVLRERRPVIIEDMETLDQPGVEEHTFVMIPLIVRGTQIGIYVLHCKKPRDSFTAGELELLGVLANHAAVAIEHSRLYNDLESTNARLKDSQDQILMSAKLSAIGELAGGVAHEVNNPLQIILSRVQLMVLQGQGNPKIVEGLRLVESNVRRISKIIRALLDFARNNAQDGDWVHFDVAQALQQANALVKHQLDAHSIQVVQHVDEDLPRVCGHMGELEQVFINLILNSQHAMPDGGRLTISAREAEGGIEIEVADTGVGIAAEHLDRIFEPFFTTHAEEGGTGLGLAVSYRIVEMHGGSLTVDSSPGEGATFFVRLPLATKETSEISSSGGTT